MVDFPHPLDAALAPGPSRSGAARPTRLPRQPERDETRLLLTPEHGWRAGRYSLVADACWRTSAGNRIGRPFDIDTRLHGRPEAHGAELAFEV